MTSIRISEMQKFHFGSKVMCSDGEVESLAHVVFDAASRHLTHLEVKEGYLFGKTFDLPYDTIIEATGDGVILRFTRTELAAASVVAVGGAVLDHRSLVEYTSSGDKGTLLLIAVHPENGALAYLVVHHLRPAGSHPHHGPGGQRETDGWTMDASYREQCGTGYLP